MRAELIAPNQLAVSQLNSYLRSFSENPEVLLRFTDSKSVCDYYYTYFSGTPNLYITEVATDLLFGEKARETKTYRDIPSIYTVLSALINNKKFFGKIYIPYFHCRDYFSSGPKRGHFSLIEINIVRNAGQITVDMCIHDSVYGSRNFSYENNLRNVLDELVSCHKTVVSRKIQVISYGSREDRNHSRSGYNVLGWIHCIVKIHKRKELLPESYQIRNVFQRIFQHKLDEKNILAELDRITSEEARITEPVMEVLTHVDDELEKIRGSRVHEVALILRNDLSKSLRSAINVANKRITQTDFDMEDQYCYKQLCALSTLLGVLRSSEVSSDVKLRQINNYERNAEKDFFGWKEFGQVIRVFVIVAAAAVFGFAIGALIGAAATSWAGPGAIAGAMAGGFTVSKISSLAAVGANAGAVSISLCCLHSIFSKKAKHSKIAKEFLQTARENYEITTDRITSDL